MFFIYFLFIINLLMLYLIFNFKKDNFESNLLNIYDEPLTPCGTPEMSSGSWDSNGLCSEKGGGVHQICIKKYS